MKHVESEQAPPALVKRSTGIPSLDAATHGGLPAHGATLVLGEPGCGKTILGLQVLAGALGRGEGGVFMSFEESRQQILRNVAAFSWAERLHDASRCEIIDAQGMNHTELSGTFDIDGLLAVLALCAERVAGTWIVLDGIDQLLRRQPDLLLAVDQVGQLDAWCEQRGITLLLTGKHSGRHLAQPDHLAGIEFLLSTILVLSSTLVDRTLHRRFRIAKYRGTSHDADELAMIIDQDGIHLPYVGTLAGEQVSASTERIGTGIARLDDVLGGGLYRGSTTLISGQPGTSKTTLAASFAEAACRRGERALFVSFDEHPSRIVRNMVSVGIDLQPHIDSGLLALHTRKSWQLQAEAQFAALRQRINHFQPDCLVIDPASSLLKASSPESPHIALERLLEKTAEDGITTLLTSLSSDDDPSDETTMAQVSTLADTWIVVRYRIHAGERNRSLSVVKSRGTAHSNQVRELVISSRGLSLTDVYQFGSEVLMGTARLDRENAEALLEQQRKRERDQRRRALDLQIEKTRTEISQQQADLERLVNERQDVSTYDDFSDLESMRYREQIRQRREPERTARQGTPEEQPGGGER